MEARIDGCRELAGNWFSPRGAVGTKRGQSPISPEVSANSASGAHASPKQFGTTSEEISRTLRFSPTRSLRAPLPLRPRWRRTRRTNKQTHRTQETRAESQTVAKKAFTRAAHTRTVKLFFHHNFSTRDDRQLFQGRSTRISARDKNNHHGHCID